MKIKPVLFNTPPLFWPSIKPIIKKVSNETDTAALTKSKNVNGLSVKSPTVSRLTENK